MDESLSVDDPELSEGARLVKLASMVLRFLGSDLGILAGPPRNSYARTAQSGPGMSLSVSQSRILGWTLWTPRRAREGPCMYALSRRPLSVIYSESESCADIAAKNCYSRRYVVSKVLCNHDRGVRGEEAVIRTVLLTACHVDHGIGDSHQTGGDPFDCDASCRCSMYTTSTVQKDQPGPV